MSSVSIGTGWGARFALFFPVGWAGLTVAVLLPDTIGIPVGSLVVSVELAHAVLDRRRSALRFWI